MLMCKSFPGWINQVLTFMGGCLGCFNNPTPNSIDEPSKGLQTVKRANDSEDFWSTSTHDLENTANQSHRSISSVTFDPNGVTASTNNPSKFVNDGLIEWNKTRLQWVASKKSDDNSRAHKPKLSWNVSYESLLGTSRRFSHAVPLSEMVEYLVDIWEHEGLYD